MLLAPHDDHFTKIMDAVVGLPRELTIGFEEEAYGASLTLIYFRALPVYFQLAFHTRLEIDMGFRTELDDTIVEPVRVPPSMAFWPPASPLAVIVRDRPTAPLRRLFFRTLFDLKRRTYRRGVDLANPTPDDWESLIQNPWSLSDSAFSAAEFVLNTFKIVPPPPAIAKKSEMVEELAAKAAKDVARMEVSDFVAGEIVDVIAHYLRKASFGKIVVRTAVRASFFGALIEGLLDVVSALQGESEVKRLGDLFKKDVGRRKFLTANEWGTYVPLPEVRSLTEESLPPGLGKR